MMNSRSFCLSFAVFALAFSGVLELANAAPPRFSDPRSSGPYAVGFSFEVLTDASRGNRPIPVYIWYPVDKADTHINVSETAYPLDPMNPALSSPSSFWEAYGIEPAFDEPRASSDGPFPTVVFSPGWGAAAWYHVAVAARTASHGFVVAVPYHWGDSALFSWEPRDHLATAMQNRPIDLSFVLDALLVRNQTQDDSLQGAIDPLLIAASGWSLGGYAAMVLVAGDDQVCDKAELGQPNPPPESCTPSFPDRRVKALVTLDGSTQVLFFLELARINVPTLGIGQEWDHLAQRDPLWATWQARLHAATQGQPAYRVDLGGGANHDNFSNLCEAVQVLGDMDLINAATREFWVWLFCSAEIPTSMATELVSMYMVSFLKTNLAYESGYQSYLTPGYALKEPYLEFFRTEKRSSKSIDEDWPGWFIYFQHQPGKAKARAEMDPATSQIKVPYAGPAD